MDGRGTCRKVQDASGLWFLIVTDYSSLYPCGSRETGRWGVGRVLSESGVGGRGAEAGDKGAAGCQPGLNLKHRATRRYTLRGLSQGIESVYMNLESD